MDMESDSFARIVENLHDGLYFVDTNRVITYWNKAAERISGFTSTEVIGRSCADNILTHVDAEGCSLCAGCCPLAAALVDGLDREAEVYMHHKDGHRVPVLVRVSTLRDKQGTIVGGIELFTDISNIQANSLRIKELEELALLDTLTRLANRRCIEREIQSRFEEMKRMQIPFGLLFIDIDHFKRFNDTYGHDVGDEVLKFVAKSFITSSRPFDLYGRWGGEEFVGIIRNISLDNLGRLGNRLRSLIEHSYIVANDRRLQVTVSLGATLAGIHDSPGSLVKRADSLLYKSKNAGRNRLTMG